MKDVWELFDFQNTQFTWVHVCVGRYYASGETTVYINGNKTAVATMVTDEKWMNGEESILCLYCPFAT